MLSLSQIRTPPEAQNRAAQKFTKTDLAKFEHAWSWGRPHLVCFGAEKNFMRFAEGMDGDGEPVVDQNFFRRLVAKAILFRTAERLFSTQDLTGYRANSVAYAVAWLAARSGWRIHLDRIWESQRLSTALCDALKVACAAAAPAHCSRSRGTRAKRRNGSSAGKNSKTRKLPSATPGLASWPPVRSRPRPPMKNCWPASGNRCGTSFRTTPERWGNLRRRRERHGSRPAGKNRSHRTRVARGTSCRNCAASGPRNSARSSRCSPRRDSEGSRMEEGGKKIEDGGSKVARSWFPFAAVRCVHSADTFLGPGSTSANQSDDTGNMSAGVNQYDLNAGISTGRPTRMKKRAKA